MRVREQAVTVTILCQSEDRFRPLAERLARHGIKIALPAARRHWRPEDIGEGELFLIEHPAGERPVWPLLGAIGARRDAAAILLLSHDDPIDRIIGLEMGAVDCIGPDCCEREIVARIRSQLRLWSARPGEIVAPARTSLADATTPTPRAELVNLQFSRWTLNLRQRKLLRDGIECRDITSQDLRLLSVLARHAPQIVGREQLLYDFDQANPRKVDVAISRLRRKLRSEGEEVIRTVRARGYLLLPEVVRIA